MTQNILQQRGIERAALDLQWVAAPNPYDNKTPGWTYPVFDEAGGVVASGVLVRWKAADNSSTPKYVWFPNGETRRQRGINLPVYYTPTGLKKAIEKTNGDLHFVSGEPDLLTMRTVGFTNVICTFGEGNIDDLPGFLQRMGVKCVYYWRDMDDAGYKAAQKVRDALQGSDVAFECRALAGSSEKGYDLNKLWIDARFDKAVFLQTLQASPAENLKPTTTKNAPRRSKPRQNQAQGDLYERWCLEVEEHAINAWHLTSPDASEYSQKILCPFHQENSPSAKWNYRNHRLHCFGACHRFEGNDTYSPEEIAEHLGHETFDEFKQRNQPVRTSAPKPQAPRPNKNGNGKTSKPILVSGKQSALEAKKLLLGEKVPDVEPFLCPYAPLRQFGGLARLFEPRKAMLIISGSGFGKTALCERINDNANIAGMDTIMWGPEWTPQRYQSRRIARFGGPSVEKQMEHEIHKIEVARKLKEQTSKPLSKKDLSDALHILDTIGSWAGDTHYIDTSLKLSQALEKASQKVEQLRAQGRRITMAIFDYAQKALSAVTNWADLEMFMNMVWSWGVEHDVFVIIVSQVNKGEAERVRTSKTGYLLSSDSAQMLSEQKVNLAISLNPVFRDNQRHERAWIVCLKNSIGSYPAKIQVRTALFRHDWTDEVLAGITSETTSNGFERNTEGPPPREYTDEDIPLKSWVKD
jgi:hypothetical protein